MEIIGSLAPGRPPTSHELHHHRPNIDRSKTRPGGNKCSVLVDVVKLMQDLKVVPLPSIVGFERAERIDGVLPHALYFSANMAFVFRGLRRNEKAGFLPIFDGSGSDEIKLLGQMVEGGSEVLDGVAQNCRDGRRNLANVSYMIDRLSRLRIALRSDFVGVCSAEGADSTIQVSDVYIGPLNFVPNKREPFVGGHEKTTYQ